MVISRTIQLEIEKNAKLYNVTKEEIKERTRANNAAVKKLKAVQNTLLDETDEKN